MNELLQASSQTLAEWLNATLPALSKKDWWSEHVLNRLTYKQRAIAEQRRATSLLDLDLEALLRVFDQNWNEIAGTKSLPRDVRTWIKELQSVRNRWAHPPAGGIPDNDAFRDVDTLERLLKVLGADEDLLRTLKDFKAKCLSTMTPLPPSARPTHASQTEAPEEPPPAPPQEPEATHAPPSAKDGQFRTGLVASPEPARRVTKVWQSKTGGQYRNVGIEAQVIKVTDADPRIVLTFVDENGDQKTVEDFGRDNKFEKTVFDYLKARADQGGRAFFILTKKPDDREAKLASNTMMLSQYRHYWQQ